MKKKSPGPLSLLDLRISIRSVLPCCVVTVAQDEILNHTKRARKRTMLATPYQPSTRWISIFCHTSGLHPQSESRASETADGLERYC